MHLALCGKICFTFNDKRILFLYWQKLNAINKQNKMKNIRTVTFNYGTCKDAVLKIPVGPHSIAMMGDLLIESYLEYMFGRGSLMSDEVLVSSIGHDNFFAGALGGYETRLNPEDFTCLKHYVDNDIILALAVTRYRNPSMSKVAAYLSAAKNEALSQEERGALKMLSTVSFN